MKVHFFHHDEWGIDPSIFNATLSRIDQFFPAVETTMNVAFVDNSTIHQLNLTHLQRDYPTDVLSFPYNEGGVLGELYIGVDIVREQASERNIDFSDELNKIFVHGFLHLKGHTHEEKGDSELMEIDEKKLLE